MTNERKKQMNYPGEKQDLTNDLDGIRQELFHLAHQVDEALRTDDLRKLRAAHKRVMKLMAKGLQQVF